MEVTAVKQLYKNIRKFREELELSQEELAKKIGYKSRTSIAKIEAGKVDLSNSKIEDFAKVFGISSIDLNYADSSLASARELVQIDRTADGKDGLIAILNDIYGDAKMHEVFNPTEGSCFYFSLDEDTALSEENFDKLYDSLKPVIKQFADLVKEDRQQLYEDCLDTVKLLMPNAAHESTKPFTAEERQDDEDMLD